VANMPSLVQQPAEVSVQRDWQRPDEAAGVGSLLGAAALLLDAHRNAKAGSKNGSVAQAQGLTEAEDRTEPALVCHMPRHLRLASRILLAPWHLQEQVTFATLSASLVVMAILCHLAACHLAKKYTT
jgi:hypothetical protein